MFFLLSSAILLHGQNNRTQYLGLNLMQLPAGTINTNYSVDYNPLFTPIIDLGYTFNYVKFEDIDIIGYYLTRHNDLYDGYTIGKRSGGYIKLGGFINLRKHLHKKSYFHLGMFLTNSLVHEKGFYLPPNDSRPYSYADRIEHTVYILGFSSSLGYELNISKRFKSNLDFQMSIPACNGDKLYSYVNFIPGMGLRGNVGGKIFPMLILNLKYRL